MTRMLETDPSRDENDKTHQKKLPGRLFRFPLVFCVPEAPTCGTKLELANGPRRHTLEEFAFIQ